MNSIELIKGSDGSGNAATATVQSSRLPGASTINVDIVDNINPTGFIGTMGTPHTFTDPVTSEVITIISEESAVDFVGHIDGENIEIDEICPGYADTNGSAVGDIIVIRPTTHWANNVAEVLEEAHEDDGSIKVGVELKDPKIQNADGDDLFEFGLTGSTPSINAVGGDTNVGLNLASKGTGEVQINGVPVSGPSSDWVPTYSNFTLGNGTVVAKYKKTGKWVKGSISILIGSTSSITGQLLFSLPSTAAARYTGSGAGIYALGAAYVEDAGTAGYTGIIKNFSTTQAFVSVTNASGTYGVDSFVRSNVPFTFGTGDFLTGTFEYEEA